MRTAPASAEPQVAKRDPLSVLAAECPALGTAKPGSDWERCRECKVTGFRELDAVDADILYYAIYCLIRKDADTAGGGCEGNDCSAPFHGDREGIVGQDLEMHLPLGLEIWKGFGRTSRR